MHIVAKTFEIYFLAKISSILILKGVALLGSPLCGVHRPSRLKLKNLRNLQEIVIHDYVMYYVIKIVLYLIG